jgi:hypothetical protein
VHVATSYLPVLTNWMAIALVLKAIGEAEPLPSAILAISLARRQWCEREVAHPTDTREEPIETKISLSLSHPQKGGILRESGEAPQSWERGPPHANATGLSVSL